MRRLFLVVLLLALAATVAVQAEGKFGFGLWEGQRSIGVMSQYYSASTLSVLEGGVYIHWEGVQNLALRAQISYLKGNASYSNWGNVGFTYEDKFDLVGFPIQFNVLPSFHIGDRAIIRAGGGLSYYKLSAKETYTSAGNSSSTPQYGVTGLGGQLLLTAEGKLNSNIGLEAQYERGTAKLSYSYTWTPPYYQNSSYKESSGAITEAFRLGLAFHF